jgi:hypothetical protein
MHSHCPDTTMSNRSSGPKGGASSSARRTATSATLASGTPRMRAASATWTIPPWTSAQRSKVKVREGSGRRAMGTSVADSDV